MTLPAPTVEPRWSDKYQTVLYHVSVPGTSKRLIFGASDLESLAGTIHRVLQDDRASRIT